MESDIRYYRRRAFEEMNAATRAVTEAARQRRLELVDLYIQHLQAVGEPSPFDDSDFDRLRGPTCAVGEGRPAFGWKGDVVTPRRY